MSGRQRWPGWYHTQWQAGGEWIILWWTGEGWEITTDELWYDDCFWAVDETPLTAQELGELKFSKERQSMTCDFCSSGDRVIWEYMAHSFEMSEGHMSLGAWAACEICSELIEAEKWKELAQRSYRYLRFKYANNQDSVFDKNITVSSLLLLEVIEQTHAAFRKSRFGRRRPIEVKD